MPDNRPQLVGFKPPLMSQEQKTERERETDAKSIYQLHRHFWWTINHSCWLPNYKLQFWIAMSAITRGYRLIRPPFLLNHSNIFEVQPQFFGSFKHVIFVALAVPSLVIMRSPVKSRWNSVLPGSQPCSGWRPASYWAAPILVPFFAVSWYVLMLVIWIHGWNPTHRHGKFGDGGWYCFTTMTSMTLVYYPPI